MNICQHASVLLLLFLVTAHASSSSSSEEENKGDGFDCKGALAPKETERKEPQPQEGDVEEHQNIINEELDNEPIEEILSSIGPKSTPEEVCLKLQELCQYILQEYPDAGPPAVKNQMLATLKKYNFIIDDDLVSKVDKTAREMVMKVRKGILEGHFKELEARIKRMETEYFRKVLCIGPNSTLEEVTPKLQVICGYFFAKHPTAGPSTVSNYVLSILEACGLSINDIRYALEAGMAIYGAYEPEVIYEPIRGEILDGHVKKLHDNSWCMEAEYFREELGIGPDSTLEIVTPKLWAICGYFFARHPYVDSPTVSSYVLTILKGCNISKNDLERVVDKAIKEVYESEEIYEPIREEILDGHVRHLRDMGWGVDVEYFREVLQIGSNSTLEDVTPKLQVICDCFLVRHPNADPSTVSDYVMRMLKVYVPPTNYFGYSLVGTTEVVEEVIKRANEFKGKHEVARRKVLEGHVKELEARNKHKVTEYFKTALRIKFNSTLEEVTPKMQVICDCFLVRRPTTDLSTVLSYVMLILKDCSLSNNDLERVGTMAAVESHNFKKRCDANKVIVHDYAAFLESLYPTLQYLSWKDMMDQLQESQVQVESQVQAEMNRLREQMSNLHVSRKPEEPDNYELYPPSDDEESNNE